MALSTALLGRTNVTITRIGLGAMPLAVNGRPSREQAIEVIHRTLDLGITLIDTADAYCTDENDKHYCEVIIREALQSYRGAANVDSIVVATKGNSSACLGIDRRICCSSGGLIRPDGAWVTDLTPSRLREAIRKSYESLGGQKPIPLWQLHNSPQDEKYTMKEIFEPICEAVKANLIQHVGVSNFNVEQIKEARTLVDIHSVQNVFSPFYREAETDGVLKYCEENKLTFLAYSPMGGRRKHKRLKNDTLLAELAAKYQCSSYCIVFAWLLSKSKCVVLIPGASKVTSIEDSVKATSIQLDQEDIQRINDRKFT